MVRNNILEKFHNKKISVFVKLFVNILFMIGFFILLFFFYRDGDFNGWIYCLIFIALTIFSLIYLNKTSLSRPKKIIINILLLIVLILLLIGFYKKLFIRIGDGKETWNIGPFLMALFIFIWIFSNKIINSIFQFSLEIDENMDSLPSNIEGKKTLVQYNLSKEITPSEAGFLLYGEANVSNLLCIIYKWYNEKIIDIYSENGKKYMKVIGKLKDKVPYYEEYLFQDMLETKRGCAALDEYKLREYNIDINDSIFKNCILKGYCNTKFNYKEFNYKEFQKILEFTGICLLILVTFLYFIKDFLLFSILLGGFFFMFIAVYIFSCHVPHKKYSFMLTDKGKKMFADIVGYKYYLENCEEEQINSDLEENEVYNKHLPYAIALKLNWKIIDKLC